MLILKEAVDCNFGPEQLAVHSSNWIKAKFELIIEQNQGQKEVHIEDSFVRTGL